MDNKSKIVVFDIDIPELLNNKVFIPEEATKISHTFLSTCYLYQEAKEHGIDFITPDVYFDLGNKPDKVLMMTHLSSSYTNKLINAGATPFILTCQESPFSASRFYLGLKRISSKYRHSFVFLGMRRHLSSRTVFHEMHFPIYFERNKFRGTQFGAKKFAVMVCGAKDIINWKKNILLKLFYGFDVKEINEERRRIIAYFSRADGFDLYGRGWRERRYKDLKNEDIKQAYRGAPPYNKKNEIVSGYKFAFCLENSVFPGYVTEKIFDAMIAGSVPIYYGAPDIDNFVDKEAFIDFRKFPTLQNLHKYLAEMPKIEYEKYTSNIRRYLASEKFMLFTHKKFSHDILNLIDREFK